MENPLFSMDDFVPTDNIVEAYKSQKLKNYISFADFNFGEKDIIWVENNEQLALVKTEILCSPIVGLDTEFTGKFTKLS